MSYFNAANFGVTGSNNFYQKDIKEDVEKQPEQKVKEEGKEHKQLQGKDVLDFMATSAQQQMMIKKAEPKTVNVAQYVDAESSARIENAMKEFEANFKDTMDFTMAEFPDLSEDAAQSIALSGLNTLM